MAHRHYRHSQKPRKRSGRGRRAGGAQTNSKTVTPATMGTKESNTEIPGWTGRRTADMKIKRKKMKEKHGATVETKTP